MRGIKKRAKEEPYFHTTFTDNLEVNQRIKTAL